MLNFRKLKQDFSSAILKEGKTIHDKNKIVAAKILRLDKEMIRFSAQILGNFDHTYESELEIDRFESQAVHSNCDCSYRYDCQHLAALVFYLEEKMDSLLISYSKETNIDQDESIDTQEKKELKETIEEAKEKEVAKKDAQYQKQILQEYISSSSVLSHSPFFLPKKENEQMPAELAVIFNPQTFDPIHKKNRVELQLALRLPHRTKPLQISHVKQFLEAIRNEEPVLMGGKRCFFTLNSFDEIGQYILSMVMAYARLQEGNVERGQRIAQMEREIVGNLLAKTVEMTSERMGPRGFSNFKEEFPVLPYLYLGSLETPLRFSPSHAGLRFGLEFIEPPAAKLLLKPMVVVEESSINIGEANLFTCSAPGMLYQEVYYRFPSHIKRIHLRNLEEIQNMTIPEPLFGTFVENALPELKRFAEITNQEVIDSFVTLPFTGKVDACCELSYLDGELEATLRFSYEGHEVPFLASKLNYADIQTFVTEQGILARNLVEERQIIEELFQDFLFNPMQGTYVAKTEKKIVEFMTETIPNNQHRVQFVCPQNLLDQFIYDDTQFHLHLDYKDKVGFYQIDLKVEGALKGIRLDILWDCVGSKRSFIELDVAKGRKKGFEGKRFSKILVFDLEILTKLVQLFDELGVKKLDNYREEKPLWNLGNIDASLFEGLPITFSISEKLQEIRSQMLGEKVLQTSPIPKTLQAELRPYQIEGVNWLERLRLMYLNGILADDMGLGKTLQTITALSQLPKNALSLIVCPTSLLYNWKEEIHRFNPHLKAVVIDGTPLQRKKQMEKLEDYQIVITSYTLLQKDIDVYKETTFCYAILDEAQHIKNRGTRNAKSVKMIQASHRLILTGTPIENSLEELWSLFDFLMPGLLSTFERFSEKYLRATGDLHVKNIEYLKKKIFPFILRRMKVDVLKDLPPVSEITYHCQLSPTQMELYRSYAESARNELTKLVEKEGFDKVQIHVLATLTRLKQICCHPAIFAKEKAEVGDSTKYEMLLELLQTLVQGGHKTVIFSQYTRMLQIMREDFEQRGIPFSYLDGSTKNRLEIVKEFNENKQIPVFLVSLKAGGTGLNLIGADTVIHYDMWWNPAVENQATDRVHRIGQRKNVSSYKLVTLGSIEEKIVEMQRRKKGLVKKVISCDDEAIAKLTWQDVLELLAT